MRSKLDHIYEGPPTRSLAIVVRLVSIYIIRLLVESQEERSYHVWHYPHLLSTIYSLSSYLKLVGRGTGSVNLSGGSAYGTSDQQDR